jgi:hypothetical protein
MGIELFGVSRFGKTDSYPLGTGHIMLMVDDD